VTSASKSDWGLSTQLDHAAMTSEAHNGRNMQGCRDRSKALPALQCVPMPVSGHGLKAHHGLFIMNNRFSKASGPHRLS